MSDPAGGPHSLDPAPPPSPPPSFGYHPAALKPGIVPLRPLTLTEIFNGAVGYIRKNPRATLGLTAVVVVVSQLISLALQISPLAAFGALTSDPSNKSGGVWTDVGSTLTGATSGITTAVATIVLSGLLTVVVGRAVFGATITPGEAWRRARGRLLPLFGVIALEGIGAALLVAIAVVGVWGVAVVAGTVAAVLVGIVAFVVVVAALAYALTVLVFAPAVIVLERLAIGAAVQRSFALVRNDFWRIFGIRLLAGVVAGMIGAAVSVPFSVPGQLMLALHPSATNVVLALVLTAVGAAIAQIITAPFNAGVVVLLYADRRMRSEAFDLVLRTAASITDDAGNESIDGLWLTAQP